MLNVPAGFGGYVSVVKFLLMFGMFYGWIPIINWVFTDTHAVKTKTNFWTGMTVAAWGGAVVLWLVIPVFIIGMMIYIISVSAVAAAYIMHRNARVADFEKVLTADHIRSIFVNENRKIERVSKGISFVTANDNEVPLPDPKSPETTGFTIACEVMEDASWKRASSVVFMPGQQEYSVVYTIDGEGVQHQSIAKDQMDYFIYYLKLMADLDTQEKRKPQKGRFKVVKGGKAVPWEVVCAGSTAGEQVAVSKLEEYKVLNIGDVGLNPSQAESLRRLVDLEGGLVIVSGPPKNGVTTTLYALLRMHDPFMNSVNTLEKRPAAELPNITQHTFRLSESGITTYPKKLQSILRMGPDVLGVADCEDDQSARLACAGAKDKKIIYVTFQATGIIDALGKWIKMVGDKNLVAETLCAIVNQRLVRRLCPECRQSYQPNQELLRKFNIPSDQIRVLYRPGEAEYDKHGRPIVCENCQGSGFVGRAGIFETIVLDQRLKEALRNARSLEEIASGFRKTGMLYMQEQSIKKVVDGTTSINEVIRKLATDQKITET